MTFGSLFAGIGGMDLGLERAAMQCKWQVEIDGYARRVLKKHWPDVRRHDDVRTFPPTDADDWRVDLIAGGFPCQDISLAGKGAGIDGERSGLWREYARIVRVLRPRFVLVENVPALLGRGIGRVLGDLAACGFDAEWDCLPASAFGAPHTRDRVWIVAHPKNHSRIYQPHCRQAAKGLPYNSADWKASSWDETHPKVCRMDDGISSRVDRTARLGNAVVPQVAQWIGERIMESMS